MKRQFSADWKPNREKLLVPFDSDRSDEAAYIKKGKGADYIAKREDKRWSRPLMQGMRRIETTPRLEPASFGQAGRQAFAPIETP
jgi:hypothetical protein